MLTIRMQRTGRSGHSQFRLIAQDSRFSPKRGRVVAYLGSYNPHTKVVVLDAEKVSKYLENGAQPSESVAKLLQKEGVKLPSWFKASQSKERSVRNPDKRRSTRPAAAEATADTPVEAEAPAPVAEEPAPAEPVAEEPAPEEAASQPAADETPAEPAADAEASTEEPETPAE